MPICQWPSTILKGPPLLPTQTASGERVRATGKAIEYALNQWDELKRVLDDAKLRLENNIAENALGRKNFLFVGNEEAGRNLATLQTIVSTCNANGVNPEAYIKDVLIRIQNTPSSEIDSLLPQNWETADSDIRA